MINPTPNSVLKMLRKLTPSQRLKVISMALPEIEKSLGKKTRPRKSLRGLWKDLVPFISADVIDAAWREMWQNFPREGVV